MQKDFLLTKDVFLNKICSMLQIKEGHFYGYHKRGRLLYQNDP